MGEELPPESLIERPLAPLPALSSHMEQGAVMSLCVECNAEWFPVLAGWLQWLCEAESWEGDPEAVETSLVECEKLQARWRWGECEVGFPIGGILIWTQFEPPDGWLPCDGTTRAVADYPDLFAVIGYTFGGAGAEFALPDLNERFPWAVKWPEALAAKGGAAQVLLTIAQMPSHDHKYRLSWGTAAVAPGAIPVAPPTALDVTWSTGGDEMHENMPPYLGLRFVIKAV